MSDARRLLFFVTEDWYFCSHRLALAVAARNAGYEVGVMTRVRDHGNIIRNAGIQLFPLEISRASTNPLREFRTLVECLRITRAFRPDILHNVALKPVLYGSIAALFGRMAVINALAGLGYAFTSNRRRAVFLRFSIETAFRLLLSGPKKWVIVQNPDDRALITTRSLSSASKVVLIPGAGVDTTYFHPTEKLSEHDPLVVLPARMLRDKGVVEFVEAARLLKSNGVRARFALVGDVDVHNPASLTTQQLRKWADDGIVEWWGWRQNMREVFAEAHVACLPSYREGLPKALLEAAACGLPIVTCDVPGCREVVTEGENGLVVAARDAPALAQALARLIADPALRSEMGHASRERTEQQFGLSRVVEETLSLYRHALQTVQARL